MWFEEIWERKIVRNRGKTNQLIVNHYQLSSSPSFYFVQKLVALALFQLVNMYNNSILRKQKTPLCVKREWWFKTRRIIQKMKACHVWCYFAQYRNRKCQYSQNDREERETGFLTLWDATKRWCGGLFACKSKALHFKEYVEACLFETFLKKTKILF